MTDNLLPRVAGPDLKAKREHYGITQVAVAKEVGIVRRNLHEWEKDPDLDPIRAHRYEQALEVILDRVLGRSA